MQTIQIHVLWLLSVAPTIVNKALENRSLSDAVLAPSKSTEVYGVFIYKSVDTFVVKAFSICFDSTFSSFQQYAKQMVSSVVQTLTHCLRSFENFVRFHVCRSCFIAFNLH